MTTNFGGFNTDLSRAINRVARSGSAAIKFRKHAEDAMVDEDIDHLDVIECLKNGSAFGPEFKNGEMRANVIHRGLEIRVVVAGLPDHETDWTKLERLSVQTTMRINKR